MKKCVNNGMFAIRTLYEAAEHFGLSKSRIQQIEQIALRKLKDELAKRYGITRLEEIL